MANLDISKVFVLFCFAWRVYREKIRLWLAENYSKNKNDSNKKKNLCSKAFVEREKFRWKAAIKYHEEFQLFFKLNCWSISGLLPFTAAFTVSVWRLSNWNWKHLADHPFCHYMNTIFPATPIICSVFLQLAARSMLTAPSLTPSPLPLASSL